eukprot:TRINITY_DN8419_c0_g1_i3.p1 TRINITY_DN8419_c0_g1~~TRINITY_DN8419_c0_g1_i3.p1  ORF type:complete len:513 (-),score=192.98 TRINITY_DN8419_c0_g1_i3:844-2265(-)
MCIRDREGRMVQEPLAGEIGRDQRADHLTRAAHERVHVHAQERGRDQPHGREHGVPPAEVVGHGQRLDAELLHLAAQEALGLVRDQEHVLDPVVAQVLLHPLLEDEILAHGLDGAAGLGHGDHHGLVRGQLGQVGLQGVGVHVVRDPQTGAVVAGLVLLREERLLERAGAQGRTADAEQEHVVEPLEERLEPGQVVPQDRAVGHGQEGQPPRAGLLRQPCGHFAGPGFVGSRVQLFQVRACPIEYIRHGFLRFRVSFLRGDLPALSMKFTRTIRHKGVQDTIISRKGKRTSGVNLARLAEERALQVGQGGTGPGMTQGVVSQPLCLLEAHVVGRHGPHLAIEVDLAPVGRGLGQGLVVVGGEDGRDDRQVQTGVAGGQSAGNLCIDVMPAQVEPQPLLQHGQNQVEPVGVEPERGAPGDGQKRLGDQGLDLHRERPLSVHGQGHGRARQGGVPRAQKKKWPGPRPPPAPSPSW